MTKEQRAQSKAICNAATPGEWYNINDGYITFGNMKVCIATSSGANAEFIAHARTVIPAALDYIEQLETERDAAIQDMTIIANAIRESELLDTVMQEGCCFACEYQDNVECPGYDSDVCFKWRGFSDKPTPCQEGE